MRKVLVVDVGGSSVKLGIGGREILKFESGKSFSPVNLCTQIKARVDQPFELITIGYPGPVSTTGDILSEPENLSKGWVNFDFSQILGKPTRVVNDAAMQAVGAYSGGRMLFIGLGTGLGTSFVANNVVMSLEIANLPFRGRRTYGDYLAQRGLKRLGLKSWKRALAEIVDCLKSAFVAEDVVIGGGNAARLSRVPPGARRGSNRHALVGGAMLWESNVTVL